MAVQILSNGTVPPQLNKRCGYWCRFEIVWDSMPSSSSLVVTHGAFTFHGLPFLMSDLSGWVSLPMESPMKTSLERRHDPFFAQRSRRTQWRLTGGKFIEVNGGFRHYSSWLTSSLYLFVAIYIHLDTIYSETAPLLSNLADHFDGFFAKVISVHFQPDWTIEHSTQGFKYFPDRG